MARIGGYLALLGAAVLFFLGVRLLTGSLGKSFLFCGCVLLGCVFFDIGLYFLSPDKPVSN